MVTFSHDYKLLASSSGDHTIRVWDATSGQCLQTLKGHSSSVYSVAFSHDDKLLASASDDRTIKMWGATSGQCIQNIEGHGNSINLVMFSHDSKLLASASKDYSVKVWNATSGQCLQTLQDLSTSVSLVVFSHDSKFLAFSSYTTIKTIEGHSGGVDSIVFSRDSALLASSAQDSTIKVWDTSSGQCLQTIYTHSPVSLKSFDISKSWLEADIVPERGPAQTNPEMPGFKGYGASSDRTCITGNSKNLLWLPPEYRPHIFAFAVSPSTVCLACPSGRVLLFTSDCSRLQ
ncbi:katanin P80 subunit [Penicillium longicatenatum]|nr:katanin P80 subunit [Penicillium longicatenatum]